jgi:hypothetical protein
VSYFLPTKVSFVSVEIDHVVSKVLCIEVNLDCVLTWTRGQAEAMKASAEKTIDGVHLREKVAMLCFLLVFVAKLPKEVVRNSW